MKNRPYRVVQALACAAVLGAFVFALPGCGRRPKHIEEYGVFNSPDGRFKIVVYRFPQRDAMMPGQSGDAPGEVCLYSSASGKLIQSKKVDMVQRIGVHEIEWSATNVYIKLFADWPFPKK